MEDKVCLDSDFLIEFLKNNPEAREWLSQNSGMELATTSINVFELYYGEYKNRGDAEVDALNEFLKHLIILNITSEIAKKAGEEAAILEKSGKALDFRDLLIGMTALYNGYSLKTNNKKHFGRIRTLKVI